MLIRIKQASSEHLWYADLIDQLFVVYVYKDKPYFWVTWFMYILPDDIEEVYEETNQLITIASFIHGES